MSLVVSRWTLSLFLQSHLVFQEGLLPSLSLPLSTAWHRCSKSNSMHRWSLKVITSRTDQSLILETRRGAAIVRSIIDPPAPRLNVNSPPWFKTIRSLLATISPTTIPLLSRRASPHSGDSLLKHPLCGTAGQPHWGSPQGGGSGTRRPRKDRWGRSSSCTHAHSPPPPKRTQRRTPGNPRRSNQGYKQVFRPSFMSLETKKSSQTIFTAH